MNKRINKFIGKYGIIIHLLILLIYVGIIDYFENWEFFDWFNVIFIIYLVWGLFYFSDKKGECIDNITNTK